MSDAILRDLVALGLTMRLSVADYERLVAALGSHDALRRAATGDLRRAGLPERLASAVARLLRSEEPDEELRQAAERDIAIVPFPDPAYPAVLRRLRDAPLVLYVEGALEDTDAVALAVVGSRRATHYGTDQAERLSAECAARGLTIVSGLARGIDSAAHQGALDGGGRTIAVLGGGLAKLYPPENAPLADAIARHGAVLTEFPLHTPPWRANFKRRNRLVSGLSLGVLVVEAGYGSGALATADWALDQGREVFALPGRVDRKLSYGCHLLIKQGARLVESPQDIIDGLGHIGDILAPPRPRAREPLPDLSDDEAAVLAAVPDEPTHIDAIADACALPAHTASSLLMVLELKRLVRQLPGKLFVRKSST